MKKFGFILVALLAVVVGLLVGTLNSAPVQLDLLWGQFELPLGLAILLGFAVGISLGLGMVYFARVLPLQYQLRKTRAALKKQDTSNPILPDD